MKKLLLGAALATVTSTAFANDYQFEVGASYIAGDIGEGAWEIDFDGWALNADIHFAKVDTSKGPLLEASFLDKSSYISLTTVSSEWDFENVDFDSDEMNSLGIRYVTENDLIFRASFTDYENSRPFEDEQVYSLGFGAYVSENIDIVGSYTSTNHSNINVWDVNFHGVTPFGSQSAFGWNVNVANVKYEDDESTEASVDLTYYINNSISLSTFLSNSEASNNYLTSNGIQTDVFVADKAASAGDNVVTAGVKADFFVMPNLHFFAVYAQESDDGEASAYRVGGAFRF